MNKLENEAENEEERADVKKLLAWANKKSKSNKTGTMVIREKKRMESFQRIEALKAVDVDAKPIIIEDSFSSYDSFGNGPKVQTKRDESSGTSRFQVKILKEFYSLLLNVINGILMPSITYHGFS